VYDDVNNTGVPVSTDPRVPGITITLNVNGSNVLARQTDANGRAFFGPGWGTNAAIIITMTPTAGSGNGTPYHYWFPSIALPEYVTKSPNTFSFTNSSFRQDPSFPGGLIPQDFGAVVASEDTFLDRHEGFYFGVKMGPSLTTTASPAAVMLSSSTGPTTLSDSAVLSGGNNPTGSIDFTLTGPNGFSYPQNVTVSGDGTYSASTQLPTTGSVTGIYTWSAHYSGDTNNKAADDQGGTAEQTMVDPATPMLETTASPAVTLDASGAPTLSDTAVLSEGYMPTGMIVFTLTGPNGFSKSQTDMVSGNNSYNASIQLPTTGTVAGTYTWMAMYTSGDDNNKPANDQGGAAEQTVVSKADPKLVTTASGAITLDASGAPTLSDTAELSGGFLPDGLSGMIVFTLTGPGGFSQSQPVMVDGNGSYSQSFSLATSGSVAGSYKWTAVYMGDANNNTANDQGGAEEQTLVSIAVPTLTTTDGGPIALGSGVALSDSATLAGGYFPTGSITFTLTAPDGTNVDTESVMVNGNTTYSTSKGPVPTVAGVYQWVASYSGDTNNKGADSAIEPESVIGGGGPSTPTITTTAGPGVVLGSGQALTDSATLSGGSSPGGTITFYLFAPGVTPNATNSNNVYSSVVSVSGNITYSSGGFVPMMVAGIYEWLAVYSGDANNKGVDSGFGSEPVGVGVVAGVYIWTGKGTNNLWSNKNNWFGNIAPGAGASLLFPVGALQETNVNDLALAFGGITIADKYSFSGQPLKMSALQVNSGAQLGLSLNATLQSGGILNDQGTLTVGAGDTLSLGGAMGVASGATLTIQGTLTVQSAAMLDDNGNLTVASTGILDDFGTAANAVTVETGVTLVNSGQVIMESNAHLDLKGTLENKTGGKLVDGFRVTVESTGLISDNDAITVTAGATLDVFGQLTEGAGGELDDFGTLIIEKGGTLDVFSTVVIEPGGNYQPLGTVKVESGGMIQQPKVTPPSVSCLAITPVAGAPFSGVVASFTDSDGDKLANFSATLDWGDGTTTSGTLAANSSGGFNVSGNHTYATHGPFTLKVGVNDTDGTSGKGTCSLTASTSGQFSTPNQNATINFWATTHGQSLIASFNGGSTSTALATWLATSFPNLYGANAGSNNLTGKTNAQVAALFLTFYAEARPKPDAQVLALALDIYTTTSSLGGTAGAAIGFQITSTGLGASFVSLGTNGAAFDAPNNVAVTAYYLLTEANKHAVNGVLYSGNSTLLQEFLTVVVYLNDTGRNS
jgi:hypothetical protein